MGGPRLGPRLCREVRVSLMECNNQNPVVPKSRSSLRTRDNKTWRILPPSYGCCLLCSSCVCRSRLKSCFSYVWLTSFGGDRRPQTWNLSKHETYPRKFGETVSAQEAVDSQQRNRYNSRSDVQLSERRQCLGQLWPNWILPWNPLRTSRHSIVLRGLRNLLNWASH